MADTNGHDADLSRRDFLKRVAGASAVALTGAGLAAALLDRRGPAAQPQTAVAKGLGDYSLEALRGKPGRMAVVIH